MFRFRRRLAPPIQSLVATACEAFLSGSYLEHLEGRDDPVPPWAWLNVLAHAEPHQVVAMAGDVTGARDVPVDERAWRQAVREIATDVVAAAAASGTEIEEIQALVLMPIEFALMSNPVGPRTTLRLVEHALQRTPGDRPVTM